jgi:hypothetical protein
MLFLGGVVLSGAAVVLYAIENMSHRRRSRWSLVLDGCCVFSVRREPLFYFSLQCPRLLSVWCVASSCQPLWLRVLPRPFAAASVVDCAFSRRSCVLNVLSRSDAADRT